MKQVAAVNPKNGRLAFLYLVTAGAFMVLLSCSPPTEEVPGREEAISFASLRASAAGAMGIEGVSRVEFGGDGWEACLGQPWNVNDGWARWEIQDYHRVIDYAAVASYQTARRRAGMDPGRLGGCGAQPGATFAPQQSSVSADSDWVQQLRIWLTPAGFLELAASNNPTVTREGETRLVSFTVNRDGVAYSLRGVVGEDHLLRRIETWIDNPVFGDMPVEAEFSDYRDFSGMRFPSSLVWKEGGFATLSLSIDTAVPNTTAAAEPPSRAGNGGFGGGPRNAAQVAPFTEIGPGIFVINGAYQAVAVEFLDYSLVIDGMQNDARTREVIAATKEAIPGKPIRYVVNTHAHFDHASGLREFVAEDATILTHQTNVEFYRRALNTPRTLNPRATDTSGKAVKVQGAGDRFTLSDTSGQTVELYKLNGSPHADDMLIAYLPAIGAVVEADLLQPWINPVFGGGEGPHPFLVYLVDELERLQLDYRLFVPVHRPNPAPTMTREDLLSALQ